MRSLLKLLLAAAAPAAAIVGGILAQLALQTVWPGVLHTSLGGLTPDSYLAVVAILLLSLLAGVWLRRRGLNRPSLVACFLVPIVWFIALLLTQHSPYALSMETFLLLAGAVAPLVGVAVGLTWRFALGLPSNNRWRGP